MRFYFEANVLAVKWQTLISSALINNFLSVWHLHLPNPIHFSHGRARDVHRDRIFNAFLKSMMVQKAFSVSSTSFTKKVVMNKNNHKISPRSYIPTFINFYSWFLIVPYKITWDPSSGKFITKSSKIRKVIHNNIL